jgi:hypothetical protein
MIQKESKKGRGEKKNKGKAFGKCLSFSLVCLSVYLPAIVVVVVVASH